MKGRPTIDGEWTEIHRRKNQKINRSLDDNKRVSFFVGNIPDGVGAGDLKETFKRFGNLADVYMARKKDKHGGNFGFIRYDGVNDAKKLEASFGKICMGNRVLAVNISRYQRMNGMQNKQNVTSTVKAPHVVPSSAWNLRSHLSFANAVIGGKKTTVVEPSCIKLNMSQEINKVLAETFLIGEVIQSDALVVIPNLLKDQGINFKRVFFYGGLHVLIGFEEEYEAEGLLNNLECWSKWFKWLKPGNHSLDLRYHRATDVDIIGLPVQYRSSDNISKILACFGKVLLVDDDVWKTDMSTCGGCIITEEITMINKELIVEIESNKHLSIGIIEKGFNLKPFENEGNWGDYGSSGMSDNDSMNSLNENEDADKDGSDGISESWNNNDLEDGEFRPVNMEVNVEDNIPTSGDNIPESGALDDAVNVVEDQQAEISNVEVSRVGESIEVPTSINSMPTIQIPWDTPNLSGPFRASAPCGLKANTGLPRGSVSKKRRRFSPVWASYSNVSMDEARSNQVPSNVSIDLNKDLNSNGVSSNGGEDSQSNSSSSIPEIRKTVEVGIDVGFVISEEDPVLRNILNGDGDQIVNQ